MKYRREIDGLRAVAVLPVVLFHAGFQAFSGGFVGVDIFFVISGYLITTIILAEKEKGTFSLVTFYERRARRILPALFFVMFSCFPFVWLWLIPQYLKDFSKSLIAVACFGSNILFWKESGYFATAAELKPLLHTWSLAVEEQYYILFPLFLMLVWKLRKRWIFSSFMVIAVASLSVAQWGALNKSSAAFFLLHTRGWELAIGALIAFYFLYKKKHIDFVTSNKAVNETFGWLGITLICYSIFAFDKTTPFPGVYALIPTVGTAFIIVFTTPQTFVGRLLGTKAMVGVGLISYSTYLWHQPLFAFARHRSLAEPSVNLLLALSLLSILLAYFSWRYVEMPFRNKEIFNRKKIFSFAVAGSVAFIALGLVGYFNNGFTGRFKIQQSIIDSFAKHPLPEECDIYYTGEEGDRKICKIGSSEESARKVAVFGDSHSFAILPAFDIAGKKMNFAVTHIGMAGCPPLLDVDIAKGRYERGVCEDLAASQYEYVTKHKIEKVFLVARWSLYTDGEYGSGMERFFLISSDSNKTTQVSSRSLFKSSLNKTIEAYRQLGVELDIVLQIPQQTRGVDIENFYYKLSNFGSSERQEALQDYSIEREKHLAMQAFNRDIINSYNNVVRVIDLDGAFCNDEQCMVGNIDESYFQDCDHMSIVGAKRVTNEILRAFLTEDPKVTLKAARD